jgi:nucleoside-diphosphate-sugar epimerase
MRVAVTGASGFVGKAVVSGLRACGHEVRTLERSVVGDLAEVVDWPAHLAGSDVVVHLAALAHARHIDPARLRAVNVDAALALGKAAAAAGIRMLHMSSVKVLGEETRLRPFDDSSPLAPRGAYARAKADAEAGLRAIPGLSLTVLRPPLVYGPGVKANFLALTRAVARGWPLPFAGIDNRRSLVYVGNLADAVLRCVESPLAAGHVFGVTDGAPLSTPALCHALGDALGRPARLFPFSRAILELAAPARSLTRSLVVDDGALRRALGWTPAHSFEDGLRRTAEWFRTLGG